MLTGLEAGDPRQVGRYRIVARLGAGGMGQVFLGRSPGGRAMAVKVVRPELAGEAGFRERFAREVAAASRVTGVFTATVVDADLEGSPAWLATEYVPGMSLGDALAKHGRWPEQAVLALGAGLAEALEAIHAARIVHRDLKPSNVLLAPDGPRVIDFGISMTDEVSMLTQTGTVVGTPGFMSPEQLTAGGQAGPASDVFSLGAVLAFAATGSGPFGTGAPHALHYRIVHEQPDLSALPPRLGDLVAGCLAKNPEERPTVAALLDRLGQTLQGDGEEAPRLHSALDWLPPAVARSLRDDNHAAPADPAPQQSPQPPPRPTQQPAPQPAGEGPDAAPGDAADQTATRTGRAPAQPPPPVHPPTAIGSPAAPPPQASRPAPPPPARTPANRNRNRNRNRRSVLAAAVALGAAGTGFTAWKLGGGEPSGDPSGDGQGAGGAPGGAADARSGTERWSVTDFTAMDSPAVADGTLYVAGTADPGSRTVSLHALDAADGNPRWTFPHEETSKPPAVADGTVYLTVPDRRVHAIDAADGKELWTFVDYPLAVTTPAAADGTVYVSSHTGTLYALAATGGELLWTYRHHREPGSTDPAPVVAGGTVYVVDTAGTLHAVDAATGKKRWTHLAEKGAAIFSPAAVANGTVYFSAANGSVYAVDASGGRRRWSSRISDLQPSGPVVADGTVYVHDFTGSLYALDGRTGKQRWTSPLGGDVNADPVAGGGSVCFVTTKGKLSVVHARTGGERWSFDAPAGAVTTPAAIHDGTVYFGINDQANARHFTLYAMVL
ncbi:serine/threonine-protein kinase [Streptomyces aculeolatus]